MIGEPRFVLERLGQHHDRASFKCTREPTLERYLTDPGRANRDNSRHVSAVYLLVDSVSQGRIAGYFTVSNTILVPESVPPDVAKRLPTYDSWGAVKLGRMARDDRYAEFGLGPILLLRAFEIALSVSEQSGSFALVVDAKNEQLAAWYAQHGLRPLPATPLKLFITNANMALVLESMRVIER